MLNFLQRLDVRCFSHRSGLLRRNEILVRTAGPAAPPQRNGNYWNSGLHLIIPNGKGSIIPREESLTIHRRNDPGSTCPAWGKHARTLSFTELPTVRKSTNHCDVRSTGSRSKPSLCTLSSSRYRSTFRHQMVQHILHHAKRSTGSRLVTFQPGFATLTVGHWQLSSKLESIYPSHRRS